MNDPTQVMLEQQQDYRFAIHFHEGQGPLIVDENPPLGASAGPSPVQLLVAAVANCLSDSLLFALRKFKQSPEPIRTEAHAEVGRNPEGRLRVLKIHVNLQLGVPASTLEHLDRVLAQFEQFCTVGMSVAQGIPLRITVRDSEEALLKWPEPDAALTPAQP